ncbi:MAG: radical SAM protein [Methanomicrobiales archaeon]|nr:radical SAM protein [Methanomicrobiales archaeon]MDI6875869.1 radical SAM protein [Methanomicrobiales archaeon]
MPEDEYRTARVGDREVPFDPTTLRRIQEHPCFSERACHAFGRMHLPVAPRCNIQCNYCVRDFDCVNESRPGVTSRVLSPEEAIEMVRRALAKFSYIKVLGIAGPGEPLYNEETFETLRLAKEEFPNLIKCISTNGLLLPQTIDLLHEYDVGNVTVTWNALDATIGARIYSYVTWEGKRVGGEEGAQILLDNQIRGIREAVKRHMIVKVNTVYIPGVNDMQIPDIAKKASELGVYTFNVIPLIPQYRFADITPPTPAEKRKMQDECARYIRQMRHCQRCRADAIGRLGADVQSCLYQQQ